MFAMRAYRFRRRGRDSEISDESRKEESKRRNRCSQCDRVGSPKWKAVFPAHPETRFRFASTLYWSNPTAEPPPPPKVFWRVSTNSRLVPTSKMLRSSNLRASGQLHNRHCKKFWSTLYPPTNLQTSSKAQSSNRQAHQRDIPVH